MPHEVVIDDDDRTVDQIKGHDKRSIMLCTRLGWKMSQVDWDMDQVVEKDRETGMCLQCADGNPTPNDKMLGWMMTQFMFLFSFKQMGPPAILSLMDECAGIDVNIHEMDIDLVQAEVCNCAYRFLWAQRDRIEAGHADYFEDGVWKYDESRE